MVVVIVVVVVVVVVGVGIVVAVVAIVAIFTGEGHNIFNNVCYTYRSSCSH